MQFEDVMKLVLGKGKQKGGDEQSSETKSEASPRKTSILNLNRSKWRQHLDNDLHAELNQLLKKTHEHQHAYKKTMKVGDAQLWVALAQMSKRLKAIEQQIGLTEPVESINPVQEAVNEPEESKNELEPQVSKESTSGLWSPASNEEPKVYQQEQKDEEKPEESVQIKITNGQLNNSQMLISGQTSLSAEKSVRSEQL
jgi:hypothetical protein